MLVSDASTTLVVIPGVPTAFALLFLTVGSVSSMDEDSVLSSSGVLRAILSCLASCPSPTAWPECMCHQLQGMYVFKTSFFTCCTSSWLVKLLLVILA